MTTLQSELKHKQPEHDAIENDLTAWLNAGHVIEILGTTQQIKHGPEYTIRSYQERKQKCRAE